MLKILSVDFPFLDDSEKVKNCPVLCLTKPTGRYKLILISYITTKTEEQLQSDIVVDSQKSYFNKTGLSYTSIIKLHKITTISAVSVKGEAGSLPPKLEGEIKRKLKKLLEL